MGSETDTYVARTKPPRQESLVQIFRGDSPDVKLRRTVAACYIDTNPSQIEIVQWLQVRKVNLPSNWAHYHFADWTDAWKVKPELVKRFLSGVTGKLRNNGYQVGRPYKM